MVLSVPPLASGAPWAGGSDLRDGTGQSVAALAAEA